jgi:glycolate oxidase FAD binding subunit
VNARVVERPTSVAEASALLRETDGTVLFHGAGTALGWGGRVPGTDLVVDTRALTGVLDHTPGDMTASVRAGTPLAELQAAVGEHGQWLALDPPTEGAGATVGGLLAAGDSGPSRLRYGNLRDLVIGVTLVLPDGTVARSGGHVIKNVAGYDLAKLVHGSMGSLALVVEVVVRLHPRPVGSVTTVGPADAQQAADAAARLTASTLEPTAVEWFTTGADPTGRLVVRSDGSPVAVAAAAAQVEDVLAGAGVQAASCPPSEVPGLWDEVARAVVGEPEETVVRLSTLPSDLSATADHARGRPRRPGWTSGWSPAPRWGCTRCAWPDRTPGPSSRWSTRSAVTPWTVAAPSSCGTGPPASTRSSTPSAPRRPPRRCCVGSGSSSTPPAGARPAASSPGTEGASHDPAT